jgi:hypothetical protein
MTVRQRMLAVFRNTAPDKIPVSIYNRYHRVGEVERVARNHGLGILHFEPAVSLLAPPWHLHPGYVSEVKGAVFSITLTWENGEQVETRTYETPLGSICQRIVKDPVFGSDWINKHYIKGPEDYTVMRYIVENTVFKTRYAEIKQKIEDLGEDGVVLGRVDRLPYQKLLLELAGPERLFIDLARNPKPVLDLLDIMDARQGEQFELALQSGAEVIWQPDNITADMTPPKNFEKYILPLYQERGQACRKAGKVYTVHMDGRLDAIKGQIARSPFDVVESFSFREMGGDLSTEEALSAWPDKVLCPNFPASLADRPREEIEAYLRNMAASFGERPFMLQISEDIPLSSYGHVLPALTEILAAIKI